MKKYLLFSFAFLLPTLSYSQGWVNVNIPVITEAITGISFVSHDTGFVITASGKFGRTFDAAKSWDVLSIAKNTPLEDVHFYNGKIGFVCARKGQIFRTTDGGLSWAKWSSGDTADYFSSIDMKDSLTGYVVGLRRLKDNPMTSIGFRTTDGGKTWVSEQTKGMGYAQLVNVHKKLYLLSFGLLHTSTDFGKTWTSISTTDGSPGRTVALNGATGIIGGMGGMRSYSTDSGKTWQLAAPDSGKVFIASELINEQTGYLGGAPAILYVTNDGGKSWGQELPARQFDILAFCLIEDRLYAVGSGGGITYKKVR